MHYRVESDFGAELQASGGYGQHEPVEAQHEESLHGKCSHAVESFHHDC